jgi:hypothetical protein
MRNVAAAQNPALDDLLRAIAQVDLEIEDLALALAEQQAFAERIALVVLLENAERTSFSPDLRSKERRSLTAAKF